MDPFGICVRRLLSGDKTICLGTTPMKNVTNFTQNRNGNPIQFALGKAVISKKMRYRQRNMQTSGDLQNLALHLIFYNGRRTLCDNKKCNRTNSYLSRYPKNWKQVCDLKWLEQRNTESVDSKRTRPREHSCMFPTTRIFMYLKESFSAYALTCGRQP